MLYLLVIILPLFNLIFFIFFSNFVGISYVYCSIIVSFLMAGFCIVLFFNVVFNHCIYYVKLFDWADYFDFFISLDFVFDELSLIMLLVVLSISLFVQSFSKWYMANDPYFLKFFFYLNFFVFFMILLVLANNIVFIFIGWEGIGIFSYLLINFWHTRAEANRSALKAIVFNKIGDCFFYLFIVLFYFVFENFNVYNSRSLLANYSHLNFYFFNCSFNIISVLGFFLILAAAAKSAQLFLHVWLPDAMEGPTPVSALLHAATMVTAGIYLLLKFSWILQNSLNLLYFIIFLGIFTNIFASLSASFQSDVKKIIAFSTASQLGLIFIAFGLSKFSLVLFHIFTHAFFKALLFLLAGVLIHFYKNKQDIRFFKSFNNFFLFFLYVIFLLASLTLATVPFFSAYYSKDFFVQLSLLNVNYFNYFAFFFLNFSVFTTAIYSYKIIDYVFWNKKLFSFNNLFFKNKISIYFISIYFLGFFSVILGYIMFVLFKFDFLIFSNVFVYNLNLNNYILLYYFEYTNVLVLFLMFFGFIFGYYLNFFFSFFSIFFNNFFFNLYFFFNKKYLFDNIYYYFFVIFYKFLVSFFVIVDRSLIEFNINSVILFFKKNSLKTTFLENALNIFSIFSIILFFLLWNYYFLVFLVIFVLKYF